MRALTRGTRRTRTIGCRLRLVEAPPARAVLTASGAYRRPRTVRDFLIIAAVGLAILTPLVWCAATMRVR